MELRALLLRAAKEGKLRKPTIVGVITPYRDQVSCIEAAFRHALGKQLASEVRASPAFAQAKATWNLHTNARYTNLQIRDPSRSNECRS